MTDNPQERVESFAVTCPSCGAPIDHRSGDQYIECVYCGTICEVDRIIRTITPIGIDIEFETIEEDADGERRYLTWHKCGDHLSPIRVPPGETTVVCQDCGQVIDVPTPTKEGYRGPFGDFVPDFVIDEIRRDAEREATRNAADAMYAASKAEKPASLEVAAKFIDKVLSTPSPKRFFYLFIIVMLMSFPFRSCAAMCGHG
ncbi:MAG: hypothetical protein H6684_00595 [Deltaproteobacteria bacterium]|nr:hypothetical protein [Deltaproteobacteria bacterium]MCB9487208.1 hypothetical protein [Deltaproteobacteria bacterium]